MKSNYSRLRLSLAVTLVLFGVEAGTSSFQQAARSSDETAVLVAQGWGALAGGDVTRASAIAGQALRLYPRSGSVIALAVEVELARVGPLAALDVYERWLAGRKVDEPYVLRRLAHAHLRAVAERRQDNAARTEALVALAAEGETAAESELMQRASAGGFGERYALASSGDGRAVKMLIAQLQAPGGNKLAIVSALVASRSELAVPALMEMLGDAREEHRSAAADALGRLGARAATNRIRPLLADRSVVVRNAAAGALYRLGDNSGLPVLEQLLQSEHGAVRLSAVEAMSGSPDARWQGVTRELLNDPDATVRLSAARLIAPYDNALAAATLERLQRDENVAVREEAGRIMSRFVAGDFATLRRLLRSADVLTGVRAADRILALTR